MYGIYYGYSLAAIRNKNIIQQEKHTKSRNCQGTPSPKLIVSSDGNGLSRIEIRDEDINYVEEKITNKLDNIDKYHRVTKYDDILHT